MRVMAGDIGGTKTLLELSDCVDGTRRIVARARYDSRAHDDFESILTHFLAGPERSDAPVDGACLAVAGPVGDAAPYTELTRDFGDRDPAAVICEQALHGRSEPARLALERFVRIYGAQAANLALTVGARGGIYVVGGIAPRISAALGAGGLMAAFLDHPRMSVWLARVPVTVVLNPCVALFGAREVAITIARGERR